jgi:tetratricopeptide (TPR) repeat protein
VWRRFRILGFPDLQAVGFAFAPRGAGLTERYYLYAPGERRGALRILSLPSGPIRTPRYASEETLLFYAAHIDFRDLYDALTDVFRLEDPSGFREFTEGTSQVAENLGFGIEDFLETLGPEVGIGVSLGQGGVGIPDILLCLQLRDPEGFSEKARRIVDSIPGAQRREVRYLERDIVFVDLPAQLRQGGGGLGAIVASILSPNYCVDGEYLLASPFAESVKNALRRIEGGKESLLDRPEMAGIRGEKAEELGAFFFLDLKRGFEYAYYNVLRPLAATSAARESFPLDLSAIPSADSVSKHLSPMTGFLRTEKDGILLESTSPFGSGVLLGLATSVTLGLRKGLDSGLAISTHEKSTLTYEKAKIMGDTAFYRGRMEEAVKYYSIALEKPVPKGESGEAAFSRGVALHRLGRLDEARSDFEASIGSRHFVRESYYFIARGHAREGESEAAIRALRTSIENDPSWNPLEDLLRERDFDPIRNTNDFRALVRDLATRK